MIFIYRRVGRIRLIPALAAVVVAVAMAVVLAGVAAVMLVVVAAIASAVVIARTIGRLSRRSRRAAAPDPNVIEGVVVDSADVDSGAAPYPLSVLPDSASDPSESAHRDAARRSG